MRMSTANCAALMLTLVCLPLTCFAARPGIDLAWDGCWEEGAIGTNRIFTCDSNVTHPVATMVGSFAILEDMPDFVGLEAIIDVRTASDSIPAWWQFYPGGCRATSLSASADFSTFPQQNCLDPFAGLGPQGGVFAYKTVDHFAGSPEVFVGNGARIKLAFAIPAPSPIVGGTTYLGFALQIDGRDSFGTHACTGCVTPACFLLEQIRVAGTSSDFEVESNPMNSTGWLGWQCAQGGIFIDAPESFQCYGNTCVTASRNRTWGSIKALYRN